MDFQLLRDENDGVKLPRFSYFVKASLIFYTPASCIDSFWCNLFFPLATLSFWVSEAEERGHRLAPSFALTSSVQSQL